MYELIQSHGRTDVYLFFAGLGRDNELVMEYWVTEEKWKEAIDVLNRQVSGHLCAMAVRRESLPAGCIGSGRNRWSCITDSRRS